ncbi:OLC1v1038186C1 [Oldenlandia corymbosa var. corymbosa]|uniref:OLC1v1038186C1 n=1 Tax=Oldenlandia corymbosa var. corymbosa TaxID=529605 RepID=A0AAV1D0Q5_OLDCO|nr:OLC1v1038186C1 [Oldenlandia corymbosa var. corymbosa]
MAKMNVCVRMMIIILVLMMIASNVSSDFAEDKKECQNQLLSISPCLPFLSEQSKFPTPICCINLGDKYDQKRRCLCMAVKDRNEPGFGIKVNATLALGLPSICRIPNNVTQCIDFLNMDPQSPEAQIFKQSYDNVLGNSSSITTSGSSSYSSSTPSSSSKNHVKRWLNSVTVAGISVWLLISSLVCVI